MLFNTFVCYSAQTPDEIQAEKDELKRTLIRKLSFRPTVGELKERRIIKFNDYIEVTDVQEYDRKGDKPWMRLTQQDKVGVVRGVGERLSSNRMV